MIKIGATMLELAEQMERERGIPKEVILSSLKEAMVAAYKRYAHLHSTVGIECRLFERTGEIGLFELRTVVKDSDMKAFEEKQQQEKEERERQRQEKEHLAKEQKASSATEAEALEPPAAHADQMAHHEEAHHEEAQHEEVHEETLPMIGLKEARKMKPDVEVGEVLEQEVTPEEFGRIAAQTAKQVIMQRIREAEKLLIQREFEEKQGQVVTAVVQRIEGKNVIVSIGKSEAVLPPREQLPGEYYRIGNKLRVFVLGIRDTGRVPQIVVSQGHAAMVREVFELEVPEIEDGIVEIKSIAREAGYRTKVAVASNDPEVDAQGACIGSRGSRIQAIVSELKNEKIDIIRWSENPVEFITHALAPSKIVSVSIFEPEQEKSPARALVVVPDDQLSLAIGRDGQNVRLAAKLTAYRIDIKSVSQLEAYHAQQQDQQQQTEELPVTVGVGAAAATTEEASLSAATAVAQEAEAAE